jgi:hypothetical protein
VGLLTSATFVAGAAAVDGATASEASEGEETLSLFVRAGSNRESIGYGRLPHTSCSRGVWVIANRVSPYTVRLQSCPSVHAVVGWHLNESRSLPMSQSRRQRWWQVQKREEGDPRHGVLFGATNV